MLDGKVPVSERWHFSQARAACFPVNGKREAACEKRGAANFGAPVAQDNVAYKPRQLQLGFRATF